MAASLSMISEHISPVNRLYLRISVSLRPLCFTLRSNAVSSINTVLSTNFRTLSFNQWPNLLFNGQIHLPLSARVFPHPYVCTSLYLSPFFYLLFNFVDVLASKRQRENYLQASWLITRLQPSTQPLPSPPLLHYCFWFNGLGRNA